MMKRAVRIRVFVAAAVLSLLSSAACATRAATGDAGVDPWRVRGAVVKVDDTSVHVRHKSGRVIVFTVDGSTILLRGAERLALESLQTGRRVVVDARPSDAGVAALRIELF